MKVFKKSCPPLEGLPTETECRRVVNFERLDLKESFGEVMSPSGGGKFRTCHTFRFQGEDFF